MALCMTCLTTLVVALVGAHSNNVDDVRSAESLLELGTHRHLQAIMSNMTVQAALARPPSMPTELMAFVRQQLGGSHAMKAQAFLQANTAKYKKTGEMSVAQLDLTNMNADQARVVLNKLALDTMSKLDMSRVECMSQQATQKQLLEETGQDVSSFNEQGTTARAQLMATQTAIKRLEELVPQLNLELSLHDGKCNDARTTLKKQISLRQQDSATLSTVSGSSGCSMLLQTGIVHCHKHHNGRDHSFVAFRHAALRRKAAQLKLPGSRRALQVALLETFATRHHRQGRHHHRRGKHARSHRSHKKHRHQRHRHGKHRRHHQRQTHSHQHGHKHLTLLSQDSKTRKSASALNGKAWPSTKGTRCSMRSNPDCNTLRDKLMLMQAGALDELDGRRAQLATMEEDCQKEKTSLQEQLQSAALRLQEQQEMLAEATSIMIAASEQSRLKGNQLDTLESERTKMDAFCQETVGGAAVELCKIKSIRQELYKMEKARPFIQDCEVSSWTPEECSKPCDGGVQNLVRQVVVPDDKGAACPPLTAQHSCNTHSCPINCAMGEWSGWTSCSSKCGGGIKQRIRHVKQRSQHGGKVCGAETESVGCSMAACDTDCKLASWSKWSTCSKACGGGFQERTRRAVVPVNGLGFCAAEDSQYRLQYQRCNSDMCKANSTIAPLLKCAGKVDVILLLDGSGSLGKEGFNVMKKAGADLVKAMDGKANGGDGAQIAVLMYSGPKNMGAYKKCIGQGDGKRKVDLVMDCKMIWVSHFTTDNQAVAENIGNLFWQKGSTMTSQALASAEAELVYGRPGAQQVVITLADKLPMMPLRTGQAAASLRKKARLIWAAATGPSEMKKFASWASKPVADNFVYMHSLEDFAKPANLNKIIAAACPKVE